MEDAMFVKFAELPVFDQQRAKDFYTTKLGCSVEMDAPYGDDGWRWIAIGFRGARTTLHFARRPDDNPSDRPVLVLVDPDVAGVVERLRAAGVSILSEPRSVSWSPGQMVAEFRDSEGNKMVISSN
jgi:predicted enzyme related to lactoylglutathione lyase